MSKPGCQRVINSIHHMMNEYEIPRSPSATPARSACRSRGEASRRPVRRNATYETGKVFSCPPRNNKPSVPSKPAARLPSHAPNDGPRIQSFAAACSALMERLTFFDILLPGDISPGSMTHACRVTPSNFVALSVRLSLREVALTTE